MKKNIQIDLNKQVPFNNKACFCIGTGRMNLALHYEYHKQLEKVQKEIGFSYIRGHGLFCDDMAIYHTYKDGDTIKEEYNFTYVDRVFDDYLSMNLKPFVELGFMPKEMASGDQTVFYWKGNVTPPSDYGKWARLVTATIEHWIARYGIDEVITWPFEVWNEPNLPVFWKDANMEEYFKLYDVTARAVKKIDARLRVGGPAICGVDDERWMKCFLEYCRDNKVPLDFITRHAYGTEMPEHDGHYVYQKLRPVSGFMDEPEGSRKIIDGFPEFKGMELHITEFNTSYSPRNPIHDTNLNAAYIADTLNRLGEACASYSYWTFGDVFEENGVAFTPFSGCFGLLANGCIPKPTYWTYVFFKELYAEAAAKEENFVVTKADNENIRGAAWNPIIESASGGNELQLNFTIDNLRAGAYFLLVKTADETTCNPLKAWLDMGSPPSPVQSQLEILLESARPQITTKRVEVANSAAGKGAAVFDITLKQNAVVFFDLKRVEPETDRGFCVEKVAV